MTAYYNEIDPFAAEWLRKLIAAGHIAPGEVDERSIEDVAPDDLWGFTQCHFFAGIGGWSYALRLAGWPDDKPVWTGSPPCQPYSVAGKQRGAADPRHLAPQFLRLVAECSPANLFGEQVAAAIKHGWLDTVFDELENAGYACGAAVLPACSVGAPHQRNRLFFGARSLAHTYGEQFDWSRCVRPIRRVEFTDCGGAGSLADVNGERLARERPEIGQIGREKPAIRSSGLCDGTRDCDGLAGPVGGFWRDADWLLCRDQKWRAVEPRAFPLADGLSGRVGPLRAYGNAIVPQVAAVFVEAFTDSVAEVNQCGHC